MKIRGYLASAALMLCGVQTAMAADAPADKAGTQQQMEQRLQAAQKRLEQAASEVAELSMSLSERAGPEIRRIVRTRIQRAVLGMAIDMRDESGSASDNGVRIVSVSPGGAAEAAGLKANDVIVSFDGKALKQEDGRSSQQQLLDLIGEAKAGEAVTIEYRRDGKTAKAQVTPRRMSEVVGNGVRQFDRELPELLDDFNVREFRFLRRDEGALGSAELAELSPALGSYFGTDKGLLVVRAPEDKRMKLQDGDVIMDIDGRVPGSVGHAHQILGSYRAGETLKLHIMRQKKRQELTVEVPAMATPSRRGPVTAVPPAPPVPPMPPMPPAADDRA